jgi:hypothetical protein
MFFNTHGSDRDPPDDMALPTMLCSVHLRSRPTSLTRVFPGSAWAVSSFGSELVSYRHPGAQTPTWREIRQTVLSRLTEETARQPGDAEHWRRLDGTSLHLHWHLPLRLDDLPRHPAQSSGVAQISAVRPGSGPQISHLSHMTSWKTFLTQGCRPNYRPRQNPV